MYSNSIEQLIRAFSKLPTVGRRTAERFVFYLLKSGKKDVGDMTIALKALMDTVKSCQMCWDFADASPCHICASPGRDTAILCVVSDSQDLQAIEKTGAYNGLYHLLRGTVRAEDPDFTTQLKIRELLVRLKQGMILEVILALNPDMPGETTRMMLERHISEIAPDIIISRLARGLPMGSDLQYADEITLQSALKNRTKKQ